MRALPLVVLALTLAPALASAQAPTRDHVEGLLSGVEDTPTPEVWAALGPRTLGVLVDLYDDPTVAPFVRLRAVGAAAHYPSPAARRFLVAVARAPEQSDLFIREAVLALGRAFGEGAYREVRPFLDHPEPVVRRAAARALQSMGPRGAEARRERLRHESDPHVRRALAR